MRLREEAIYCACVIHGATCAQYNTRLQWCHLAGISWTRTQQLVKVNIVILNTQFVICLHFST